ncbi:hypothetical protein [Brumimicrobium oceani]|uniref:Uncharacterized protein n=1 Tax=Brumimicrobium oceani TaxID=2100725 RepID=A0A2U2XBN5_9FLAO|nr:hypothetical protein [Brumimicrobium oceani]PWH85177.1 hypothetical protein DIT68_11110 [Brumimicrobium oceani]
MKINKFIFLSIILGFSCGLFAQTQTQNGVWSLPEYYWESQSPIQPLPTQNPNIGYDGLPASNVSNAMQDANGDLLFFIVDDEIYDKEGYTIGIFDAAPNYPPFEVKGTSEISIVPVPGNCSQFYIFLSGRKNYTGMFSKKPAVALLDMSQVNTLGLNPGKMGNLLYCRDVQSVLPSNVPDITTFDDKQGGSYFAASKEYDGKRFVFISASERIYRFIIDINGFQYDGFIPVTFFTGDKTLSYRGEMELIEVDNNDIKYRLDFSFYKSSQCQIHHS